MRGIHFAPVLSYISVLQLVYYYAYYVYTLFIAVIGISTNNTCVDNVIGTL